jgi:hypothetical protein
MRDNRGSTTPRDRDRVRIAATQLGKPPVIHLDDEYADLRKDRDQIRIAPPHHRLVIDQAISSPIASAQHASQVEPVTE